MDTIARTERNFALALLPHLLMGYDFAGHRTLFARVFPGIDVLRQPDDFELVGDAEFIRDLAACCPRAHRIFQTKGRVAVPDLFLRWGQNIIILEAKLFTDPHRDALRKQLRDQRRAFEYIRPFTRYGPRHRVAQLLLSVTRVELGDTIRCLSWCELLDLLAEERGDSMSLDVRYAFECIRSAVARVQEKRDAPRYSYHYVRSWRSFLKTSSISCPGAICTWPSRAGSRSFRPRACRSSWTGIIINCRTQNGPRTGLTWRCWYER